MARMSRGWQLVRLAVQLQRQATMTRIAALSGDPVSGLMLRAGQADPYPLYARMRDQAAMYHSRTGVWATTTHAVADQVLRDRRFGVQPADVSGRSGAATGRVPEQADAELLDLAGDESFLGLDPPDHDRLRRLAAPAFTPRRIRAYRDRVEKVTHELVEEALHRDSFDLIADLATPLPIAVIAELLGIPSVDADRFARYGRVVGASLDGVRSLRQARELRAATVDLRALFADLIELRRREPGGDVISRLVEALGEEQLTVGELMATCTLLLIAGFETTVNLIGNGTAALLANPDQWRRIRADPGLAPQVVEETLRFDPPVQLTVRTPHEDVEAAGRVVPRDAEVLVLLGAANRDPAAFADPDRFDLSREDGTEHLAFSSGLHYCLGAPLARMEGAVVFASLAERMPALRVAGPTARRRTTIIHGFARFPVSP